MHTLRRVGVSLAGLAVVSCLLACGGVAKVREAAAKAKTTNDLKLIGLMYHGFDQTNGKGPANETELARMASDADSQAVAAQCGPGGKYVVIWGAKITEMTAGSANTVLAYESTVPTAGGVVLFGDGAVKVVTAAEFANFPKAKPAGGVNK